MSIRSRLGGDHLHLIRLSSRLLSVPGVAAILSAFGKRKKTKTHRTKSPFGGSAKPPKSHGKRQRRVCGSAAAHGRLKSVCRFTLGVARCGAAQRGVFQKLPRSLKPTAPLWENIGKFQAWRAATASIAAGRIIQAGSQ